MRVLPYARTSVQVGDTHGLNAVEMLSCSDMNGLVIVSN